MVKACEAVGQVAHRRRASELARGREQVEGERGLFFVSFEAEAHGRIQRRWKGERERRIVERYVGTGRW
eukprot:1721308-Rhodomonas_salina.1